MRILRFGHYPKSTCSFFQSVSYNCCSFTGNYFAPLYTDCFFTLLKDKNTQMELLALARKEEILVPSCSGGYVPFELVRKQLEAN